MHPSLYVLVLVIPGCAYIGSHFLAPWVPAHFLCAFAGMCVGVWLAHFIERPRHHAHGAPLTQAPQLSWLEKRVETAYRGVLARQAEQQAQELHQSTAPVARAKDRSRL